MIFMRTTVDLSDALFKRAKTLANKKKATLRQLVEEGLCLLFEREEQSGSVYKMEDCSFGEDGLVDGSRELDWSLIGEEIFKGRGT